MASLIAAPEPKKRQRASYQDVLDAPEGMIAEIVDGELFVQPRPSPRHSRAAVGLVGALSGPFERGVGGPGGWILLFEAELRIGEEVLVPDLAAWRIERMPQVPDTAYVGLAPDWVCEILSPSTRAHDIGPKRDAYGRIGVGHLWHADPAAQTLETFLRHAGRWAVDRTFGGGEVVRAAPFADVEFPLAVLWSGSGAN
jgi:Uma2 family endonuclease